MSSVNIIGVFTTVLNNEVFTVPQGARTIDMKNVGAASGKYKGNISLSSKPPSYVTLAKDEAYSFGFMDMSLPDIIIDATGTIIEITVNY